jgi:hypothetical protein
MNVLLPPIQSIKSKNSMIEKSYLCIFTSLKAHNVADMLSIFFSKTFYFLCLVLVSRIFIIGQVPEAYVRSIDFVNKLVYL